MVDIRPRPDLDPADAAAVELADVDDVPRAVGDDRAWGQQAAPQVRAAAVRRDPHDMVSAGVGDEDRPVGSGVDADRRAEVAGDRGDDPRCAVDAAEDAVVAVRDDHGAVGEDVEPVRSAEGGKAGRPAVARIALAADPDERVDPAVRRHDPDAVVVLRDVEVAGGVKREVAVAAELRCSGGAAVAAESARSVAGDRRLRAVGLEPPDAAGVGHVHVSARAEIEERRVVEAASDQRARAGAEVHLVEARAVQVGDDQVAVLLAELESVRARDPRAGAHDLEQRQPDRPAAGANRERPRSAAGKDDPCAVPARPVLRLVDVEVEEAARISTGVPELDRVLGGGLVPASLVLVGGEPGVGKSTLLLMALASISRERRALLVTGEESTAQVKLRAARLGGAEHVEILAETDLDSICATLEADPPAVCVIDSIQTLYAPDVGSAPGSVSQVREAAARLLRVGKEAGVALFLVGHVTKDGSVAVLSRHAGIALGQADVFVNVAGGLRIDEPGADLGVALAIASAARESPVPAGVAAFGEIGLTGRLRPAAQAERRLEECAKLGLTTVIVPAGTKGRGGLDAKAVETIRRAVSTALGSKQAGQDPAR